MPVENVKRTIYGTLSIGVAESIDASEALDRLRRQESLTAVGASALARGRDGGRMGWSVRHTCCQARRRGGVLLFFIVLVGFRST